MLWICDLCETQNDKTYTKCIKCKNNNINVNIIFDNAEKFWYDVTDPDACESQIFRIQICYSSTVTLNYLINKITQKINKIYAPKTCYIYSIGAGSFIGKKIINYCTQVNEEWDTLCSKEITFWEQSEISQKGISCKFKNIYFHKIKDVSISCKHILKYISDNYDDDDLKMGPAELV
eukprot:36778_1